MAGLLWVSCIRGSPPGQVQGLSSCLVLQTQGTHQLQSLLLFIPCLSPFPILHPLKIAAISGKYLSSRNTVSWAGFFSLLPLSPAPPSGRSWQGVMELISA